MFCLAVIFCAFPLVNAQVYLTVPSGRTAVITFMTKITAASRDTLVNRRIAIDR